MRSYVAPLIFFTIGAILLGYMVVLAAGCDPNTEPRTDAALEAPWAPLTRPTLYLSADLAPCQVAGMVAAVALWEEYTNEQRLIAGIVRDVPMVHESMSETSRKRGQVAVTNAPTDRPENHAQLERFFNQSETYVIHGEIRIQGCQLRSFAHEVGHVVGLGHATGPSALMREEHDPSAWDLSPVEVARAAVAAF